MARSNMDSIRIINKSSVLRLILTIWRAESVYQQHKLFVIVLNSFYFDFLYAIFILANNCCCPFLFLFFSLRNWPFFVEFKKSIARVGAPSGVWSFEVLLHPPVSSCYYQLITINSKWTTGFISFNFFFFFYFLVFQMFLPFFL